MRGVLLLAIAAMLAAGPARSMESVSAPAQADHLALFVTDQDRSVAFYTGAFGLPEIHAPVNGPRWFDLGHGMALHIIAGRTTPLVTTKSVHFALRVQSLDSVTSWLNAHQLPWQNWEGSQGAVTLRSDGVRQIYLQDPDGYWLEVNEVKAH
jgi:lactoylglutathione lyase